MASNNYYKLPVGSSKTLTLLAACFCLPLLFAQTQSSGYLSVGDPQKVAGKRNAAVQVKIPVAVKEGYHVNSNKPNEEYLIPLKLTWTSLGALEGGTVTYPKPALEKYEFSEKPLSVYTGSFDLVANFKVAAERSGGSGCGHRKAALSGVQQSGLLPAEDGGDHRAISGAVRLIQAKYPRNSTSRSEPIQTGARVSAHQDLISACATPLRTAEATLVSVIT